MRYKELVYLSGIELGYGRDNWWFETQQGLGIFLFTTGSRPALGLTQPSVQWVPAALFLGYSGRGVKLTTHLPLVPRSKNRGAIPPLPKYAFLVWCSFKAQ
jgi:hypothetical protein